MNNVDPSMYPFDYRRFVTQDLLNQAPPRPINAPPKPFKVKSPKKSEKSKKDTEKQKQEARPRPFE
jgi:hypothetical protein